MTSFREALSKAILTFFLVPVAQYFVTAVNYFLPPLKQKLIRISSLLYRIFL